VNGRAVVPCRIVKAVFLDRDNTLIANDGDLGDPRKVVVREGVPAALRQLREAGYLLIVVTNQGGVARGKYSEQDVDAVHQRIAELVDAEAGYDGLIDRFYYCPYHPEGTVAEYRREHPWRKPQPGMLVQAARDLDLDLKQCWMIGDQARDVQAGAAAGCRTMLVSADAEAGKAARPTRAAPDFAAAVKSILNGSMKTSPAANSPAVKKDAAKSDIAMSDAARIAATIDPARSESRQSPAPAPAPAPGGANPAGANPAGGNAAGNHSPASRSGNDLESRDRGRGNDGGSSGVESLRRAVHDLAEEIRTDRLRRSEFTPLRMAAGLAQLLAVLLALLGLLQVGDVEHFAKWMAGAALLQLVVITLLLLDARS
jgi:D-glycero-D-manno-heptose 1,7-bisphosphate phosphatase